MGFIGVGGPTAHDDGGGTIALGMGRYPRAASFVGGSGVGAGSDRASDPIDRRAFLGHTPASDIRQRDIPQPL